MSQNKPWGKPKAAATEAPAPAPKSNNSGGQSSGAKTRTLLDIRTVETKNGLKPKLQLAKDVEIFYQGVKVDLGEYNSAFLKGREELVEDLGVYVEKGWRTPEQADEEVEFLNTKNITARLTAKV